MPSVVIDDSSGEVLRYSSSVDLATGGVGETLVELEVGARPLSGPLARQRVSGKRLRRATDDEVRTAEAAALDRKLRRGEGAVQISMVVDAPADLRPPPRRGLMAIVRDGGSGRPSLAISTATRWGLIDVDRVVEPSSRKGG